MNAKFQKVSEALFSFSDRHAGILLSAPALLLLGTFVLWPFGLALVSSFTNQSVKTILNPELREWVGTANYAELLGDANFSQALFNTCYFVVVTVPIQIALALSFAVVVNGSGLWKRILRVSFFLPVITSMAVLSVVWSLLYNPSFGAFNALLGAIGLPPQPFLSSPNQAMNCIVVMSVWQGVGFQMMIFLAGMQTIPDDLYEAASIAGASPFRQFLHVTLPLLKNTIVFAIFVTTIFAFKLFVQPHLITRGGPEGSTRTLILLLYDEAFTNGRYGKASAISVVFFVIVLAVALVQKFLLPKEEKW